MTWQDELSPQQWAEWIAAAQRISNSKRQATSLGAEDYATLAIEKFLQQEVLPANVEGGGKNAHRARN
jgi:hypothetical protein